MSVCLVSLPDDILLCILTGIETSILLKIRQTCKRLYSVSKTKQVWVSLYYHEIVKKSLYFAPYWKHIDDLDDSLLEGLILHALRLEYRISTNHAPHVVPFYQKRSVSWIRLIRSHWLLVASSDDVTSVITLWSVLALLSSTGTPTPLTEAFLSAPVINGAIDIRESEVIFALELRGRIDQVELLSVVNCDGRPHICRLRTIRHVGHLRFIQGDHIGVSLVENRNVPCIIQWREGIIQPLQHHPDTQGGAIAMHMADGWIAVVRRRVAEIYIYNDECKMRWRGASFSHVIGSAAFSQVESSLRLCITYWAGIFVYEVRCDVAKDYFSMNLLFQYETRETNGFCPLASRGVLGVTGESISWIEGDDDSDFTYTTRVASTGIRCCDQKNPKPAVFKWHNENTPALYALGVYDFDEARGVLVLGNVFGELSILDFSGSDPHQFERCLAESLKPSPYIKQELLPTAETSIESYPAPPFPHFWDTPHVRTETMEFWNNNRPAVVPEGWSADLQGTDEEVDWFTHYSGDMHSSGLRMWNLENAGHFYGRPLPLIHRTDDQGTFWIIFSAGGLFFISCYEYAENFMVARPGITLEELAESLMFRISGPVAEDLKYDVTQIAIGSRFRHSMGQEMLNHKRIRYQELYNRAGENEQMKES
ncbi:hypothetical protein QCA50_016895 [Cerrena zonata]|uniref:F-box domain-containing protein n=1 Tax=Cerrena zonata TaxID=2478898 RepID=A0AAW0FK65_9APHY